MEWSEERGIPKRWKLSENGKERRIGTAIVSAETLRSVSFDGIAQAEVAGGIAYAVRCLSRQAMHSAKLSKMLRRHFVSEEAIQTIVEHCKRQGWLDDESWTNAKVEAWQKRGKSAAHIRAKLREQGVQNKVLCDEAAALAAIIAKKYSVLLAATSPHKERVRAIQALLRRGFSYQKVKEFLQKNVGVCMMGEEL